jgi:hypothetical protein
MAASAAGADVDINTNRLLYAAGYQEGRQEIAMNSLRDEDKSNRAPLSSPAALVSGLILLAFLFGEWASFVNGQKTPDAPLPTWPLIVILAWGAMFAVGLVIWSFRDWFGIHWIGNPTLAVIGGVSGAIVTAVTLALTLQGGAGQERAAQQQLHVLCEQLRLMQQVQQRLGIPGQENAASPNTNDPLRADDVPECTRH